MQIQYILLAGQSDINYCLQNEILMLDYGLGVCVDIFYQSHFPSYAIETAYVDDEGNILTGDYQEIEL